MRIWRRWACPWGRARRYWPCWLEPGAAPRLHLRRNNDGCCCCLAALLCFTVDEKSVRFVSAHDISSRRNDIRRTSSGGVDSLPSQPPPRRSSESSSSSRPHPSNRFLLSPHYSSQRRSEGFAMRHGGSSRRRGDAPAALPETRAASQSMLYCRLTGARMSQRHVIPAGNMAARSEQASGVRRAAGSKAARSVARAPRRCPQRGSRQVALPPG